jgi:hypothetical protein
VELDLEVNQGTWEYFFAAWLYFVTSCTTVSIM